VPLVLALVLEELEGVRATVADIDPVATRGRWANLLGGLDPQAALAAVPFAAGGNALVGGLVDAAVQLLADQAEQGAGVRIDSEGVVALVTPAAAVADLSHGGQGHLVGVVQFR